MTLFPSRRLVALAAAVTAASVLLPALPWLGPAFAAAVAALVAVAVWDALLLRRRRPPAVSRVLPERAFVGRAVEIGLRIESRSTTPVRLTCLEDPPPSLECADAPIAVRVGPHETLERSRTVVPRERGDLRFGPLVLLEESPLGLLMRRGLRGEGDVLRVYPDTARLLRDEALDPSHVLAALGVRAARRRGEGMDFESLREFIPGDDPRRRDWAASARRGRPVVRIHQHERSQTVILAVDASRLLAARFRGRSKLDFAVDAAVALARAALATGDRVGLVVFDDGIRAQLAPRSRAKELGDVIEALRTVQPRLVEADYEGLARHFAVQRQQRALVVVLTDFVEAAAARVVPPLVVLGRRHRVLLVALRDAVFEALAPGAPPDDPPRPLALERRLVLGDLLAEREAALATLRRAGLQTLDLVPEAVTPALLRRYLALRAGA